MLSSVRCNEYSLNPSPPTHIGTAIVRKREGENRIRRIMMAKILVVDDEEAVRVLLKEILDGKGYNCLFSCNKKRATQRQIPPIH